MIIQSDSRQKRNHHKAKEAYFEQRGIRVIHSKLLCGDYTIPSDGSISIDTKANISELYSNLIQQHDRFHNECVLAKEAGIKLIILVENTDGVKNVEDLKYWKNPQYFRYWKAKKKAEKIGTKIPKPPASNVQLIKIMHAMSRDYGVEFMFCKPDESGAKIVEMLGGNNDV